MVRNCCYFIALSIDLIDLNVLIIVEWNDYFCRLGTHMNWRHLMHVISPIVKFTTFFTDPI